MLSFLNRGANFSFGEIAYPRGGAFRVAGQPYAWILLLETGSMHTLIDGREHGLEAGECGLFVNWEGRASFYAPGSHVRWCETPLLPGHPASGGMIAECMPASSRMRTLFREGLGCGLVRSPEADLLRNALGEALFAAWRFETGREDTPLVPEGLGKVRAYVEAHYFEPLDLPRLAAVWGVTPPHLVASFRRYFGTTPMRHVWDVRTQAAIRMILRTDMPLASIAELCGYSSPFHLSRLVRRMTGLCPRDLRQRGTHQPGSVETGNATRTLNETSSAISRDQSYVS
ncbi:helix-turn-helix domain-containing protein [Komagataeibacter sp. FNDCR2]|uniref:helix-turn-helix domain-containing protein n=1 Tax=Komagataeibacter sp. FNDCR2 TaxID=2878682 RepID=UPI001E4ADCBC|nr:AraC family transcriptional regulator [Komagataeibacter sp. FNDCR2]MCE2574311.1 AraC family transcriptional regulator [Komagataeibacter sp. FNDCR2]